MGVLPPSLLSPTAAMPIPGVHDPVIDNDPTPDPLEGVRRWPEKRDNGVEVIMDGTVVVGVVGVAVAGGVDGGGLEGVGGSGTGGGGGGGGKLLRKALGA